MNKILVNNLRRRASIISNLFTNMFQYYLFSFFMFKIIIGKLYGIMFYVNLGLNILFMWSTFRHIIKAQKNRETTSLNYVSKRNYYSGHLSHDQRGDFSELGIFYKQSEHPLIIDLNVDIKKLYITNVTHSKYLHGKKLTYVGIDPVIPYKKVWLKPFNEVIVISKENSALLSLKNLIFLIDNKNPVIDMKFLLFKLEIVGEKGGIKFNHLQESKIEMFEKIIEMFKNI